MKKIKIADTEWFDALNNTEAMPAKNNVTFTQGEWNIKEVHGMVSKELMGYNIWMNGQHIAAIHKSLTLPIEEAKANAELIASAPQLKADNEALKKENARAKQQIIDLIEALTPFAEVWNEFTETKRRQGGEVFQYNDKKLLVTDFEKANDLLSYLSQHQVK